MTTPPKAPVDRTRCDTCDTADRPPPWCKQELCVRDPRACSVTHGDSSALRAHIAWLGTLDAPSVERIMSAPVAPDARVMVLPSATRDGFWAHVLSVLNGALLARSLGLDYVIWRNGTRDTYCDLSASTECWSTFFAPRPIGADRPRARAVARRLAHALPLAPGSAAGSSCAARAALWRQLNHIYPSTAAEAAAERARKAFLVRHLAWPSPRIASFAESWWTRHVRPLGPGAKVLGVHVRGTDKWVKKMVNVSCYYGLIEAYVAHHAPRAAVRIFLATDDARFADASSGGTAPSACCSSRATCSGARGSGRCGRRPTRARTGGGGSRCSPTRSS